MISLVDSNQLQLFERILGLAVQKNVNLFLVGGVVRDIFLSGSLGDRDFDFIVEGDGPEFAQSVQRELGGKLKQFPAFLTAKVYDLPAEHGVEELDFACARMETYPRPGSLPVVQAAQIEQDLGRRDFTINALALPLTALVAWVKSGQQTIDLLKSELLDFFGGKLDIANRTIRVLHDLSFVDDPTRMFRGCRYCARIGGSFDEHTVKLLNQAVQAEVLATVSEFRKISELKKIIIEPKAREALQQVAQLSLLDNFAWLSTATNKRTAVKALCSISDLNLPSTQKRSALICLMANTHPNGKQAVLSDLSLGLSTFDKLVADLRRSGVNPELLVV